MWLLLDHRDSFTWNVAELLEAAGATCSIRDAFECTAARLLESDLDGLILGPGPGEPEAAGCTLELLRSLPPRVPVLGVCLGHQALAVSLGARLVRARRPVFGHARPARHTGAGLFEGLPSPLAVGRYHALVVDPVSLPPELEVTARSPEGEVLALQHRHRPWYGVQFHPDSMLTEHGVALARRFVELARPAAASAGDG